MLILLGVLYGHIVTGLNVAANNADVLAVIRINAIQFGISKRLCDADALNEHIVTAGQVDGPLGCIADGNIFDLDLLSAKQTYTAWSPVFRFENIGAVFDPKAISAFDALAINGAHAGDGNILGIVGVNQEATAVAAIFACHIDFGESHRDCCSDTQSRFLMQFHI